MRTTTAKNRKMARTTGIKQDFANRTDTLQKVFDYHQATKHHFQGYASGPRVFGLGVSTEPFSSVGRGAVDRSCEDPADR